MSIRNRTVKSKKVIPSEVFNQCPACDASPLLRAEGEAFCMICDWNSIAFTFETIGARAFLLKGDIRIDDADEKTPNSTAVRSNDRSEISTATPLIA